MTRHRSDPDIGNFRFLFNYLTDHKWQYLAGILMLFLTNLLAVSIPEYIGISIDLLSGDLNQNEQNLIDTILIVIAFACVMMFTRTLSRILFFNPGRAIERDLKNDAFATLTRAQKPFYDQHETGTLISIVNNDINGVRALAGIVLLQIFNISFALSLTPYKMWSISPSLTLYCIIPVIITFIITHYAVAYMRRMTRERMLELQTLSSDTMEFLSGIDVIKSHQIESWARGQFQHDNKVLLKRSLRLMRIRTLILPILGYTDRIMKILILAIGGGYLINQNLSLGDLTALLAYATLLAFPFVSMGMIYSSLQTGIVSLESLRRILNEPSAIVTTSPMITTSAVDPNEKQATETADSTDQTSVPPPSKHDEPVLFRHALRVNHLTYQYPNSHSPTLKNISFEIRPGERVGILGQVGSGKTTLVNCLNRYLDVAPGQIFLDDHDVVQLTKRACRSAIRTITQEPFLFSDSIENNLAFSHEDGDFAADISDRHLDDILYRCDMQDEVAGFSDQAKTLVGEKGILLSGGQKQRLSLGRALYTPSRLLILDNVLSAVDNETERFLLEQIFEKSNCLSLLIVSHRATVLEKVDRILVLDQGAMIAAGTHDELLQSCELYRRTWTLQQSDHQPSSDHGQTTGAAS